jgi:hypothetical protein
MRVNEYAVGATGSCTNCGIELKVSMANTRPLDDERLEPMGSQVITSEAPTVIIGQVDGDHCARCSRAFRGEWDQYESAQGMVCHICANRAEGPGEVQDEIGEVKPVMAAYSREGLDMPDPEGPVNPEFVQARNREEVLQKAVLFAALAMIALAIFVTLFADLDVEPILDPNEVATSTQGSSENEPAKLSGWVPWAIYSIQFFVNFGGKVLVLFLMLSWANKLPNDTFGANLIALGVVGFGLAVLDVIIMLIAMLLAVVPIMGFVWGLLGLFLTLYIIYSLYNLTFAELLLIFVASIVVRGIVTVSRILLLALLGFAVL